MTCKEFKDCCPSPLPDMDVEPASMAISPSNKDTSCDGLICFEKNACGASFCSQWGEIRDSLIMHTATNQKLLIIGFSRPGEENKSDFKNLGKCRAEEVRALVSERSKDIQIETIGQLRVGGKDSTLCDYISFQILEQGSQVKETSLIYFPKNSTDKLADRSVETYLTQIADQVKNSDQKVKLTGHTDDRGNDAYNMELGKKRAIIIRQYLIDLGVPASSIQALSEGENRPIANNDTEQGRAKNRRLELEIIE